MKEHYCDCCGHIHGDLEAHERIAQLEAEIDRLKEEFKLLDAKRRLANVRDALKEGE